MTPRQIVASYLLFQALGTAAWWGLLLRYPESIPWFRPAAWPDEALLSFWLGDFTLLIAGSVITATAVIRGLSWASVAIWSLAAAVWYPTLYCIGVSLMTGEAWIASAMMVSMACLTLSVATIHGTAQQTPATIRAIPLNQTAALLWTLAQVVIFWSVFVGIIPMGIVELEDRLGWPRFSHGGQTIAALIALSVASMLGLWSGITMAISGDGTPLPTATAPKLVVSGPYRYVRNPMAVAGILQGVSVAWLLGSPGVIVFSLSGAVLWHFIVRPIEEADLCERFGDSYRRYRSTVGLWMPRIPPRIEAESMT